MGRVSHDIGKQSSVGAVYVDREYDGNFNRVGGIDAGFRLSKNWTSWSRSLVSSTYATSDVVAAVNTAAGNSGNTIAPPAIGYTFGQDHEGVLNGSGRRFQYKSPNQDITPNFHTDSGFVPRTDIRNVAEYYHFFWRPEGKHLVFHGPEFNTHDIWDHSGVGLQHAYSGDWVFYFRHNLLFAPIGGYEEDVLRPVDFSGLPNDHKYVQDIGGLVVQGSPSRLITWRTAFIRDGTVLIVVPTGQLPITGDETAITHTMSLNPTGHLEIDNTYILDRVLNGPHITRRLTTNRPQPVELPIHQGTFATRHHPVQRPAGESHLQFAANHKEPEFRLPVHLSRSPRHRGLRRLQQQSGEPDSRSVSAGSGTNRRMRSQSSQRRGPDPRQQVEQRWPRVLCEGQLPLPAVSRRRV